MRCVLAGGGRADLKLKLWDVATGKEILTPLLSMRIRSMRSPSPEGRALSGALDTFLNLWELTASH